MRKILLSLSLLACCSANALVTMSLWETSYNGQDGVMLEFSGSVNTTELTRIDWRTAGSFTNLSNAILRSGIADGSLELYGAITGPASTGVGIHNSIYISGDTFGVFGSSEQMYLPNGYTSLTIITGQSFMNGATIASMGLTVGQTFEWTWGAGANADKVVLEIVAVPEPSTVSLLSAGAAALLTVAIRRRRNKA